MVRSIKKWVVATLLALGLFAGVETAAQVNGGVPLYTFTLYTDMTAAKVNANFESLFANALLRTGGTMTGTLTIPAGSVSAPSIGFTGDTNTGIYRVADDQVGIAANGVLTSKITTNYTVQYGTAPDYTWVESGVTADNGSWDWVFNGESAAFRLVNDALSSAANVFTIERTGLTIDSIALGGGLVNKSLTLSTLAPTTNGTVLYCSDCLKGSTPCTGSSTGAMAKRENGAWNCD